MKPTANTLPIEIISHILSFVNHAELIVATYVCRQWHAAAAPLLATLKTHVHTLSDKPVEEILTNCQHSLPSLQAVMMSNISNHLSEAQILQLALISYQHAEIILKSRFIHEYIWTQSPPARTASEMILETLITLETFTLVQNLNSLSNPWGKQEKQEFLLTLASHNLHYATLVLYHGIHVLSSFNLMSIAIKSIAHAEYLLKQADCLARLKIEHLRGIGNSSSEHARLMVQQHLIRIGREGVKQIVQKGADYSSVVIQVSIQLLGVLPHRIAHLKPSNTKWVVANLINNTFYTPANPFWQKHSTEKPQQTQTIFLLMSCLDSASLKYVVNSIIINVMKISITHTQDILTLKNIENRLSLEALNRLKTKDENYNQIITAFLEKTPLPPSPLPKIGFNF